MLLLQLCRRQSEEVCSTTRAVATPGARGVGRLPSRSKWGRYRPKTVFSLGCSETSVAGDLPHFLAVENTACGKLAETPIECCFGVVLCRRSVLLRWCEQELREVQGTGGKRVVSSYARHLNGCLSGNLPRFHESASFQRDFLVNVARIAKYFERSATD